MLEKPRISAIAAIGKNRELGKRDQLIWRLDADFERMKNLVRGHPLIMGRRTYESIGRELPYSPSIVITKETDYVSPYQNSKQTLIVNSIEDAVRVAGDLTKDDEVPEVFIFGGQQIYTAMLPQTERLYLTVIDSEDKEADAIFPSYEEFKKVVAKTEAEENGLSFTFLTLER